MSNVEFKKMFDGVASLHRFERAFGGWFREGKDSIIVLDLQKSDYSNLYYLNIKIYVRGIFASEYGDLKFHKKLVKTDVGHIFRREPREFSPAFDLENDLVEDERHELLTRLFEQYMGLFSERASTKEVILQLAQDGHIFLLPAVREEMTDLINRKG